MILAGLESRPVIAHRGASGLAPENTIAALQLGVEQGANAVEFDVRLAACDTPVLAHDPLLDRTTSWQGPVRARTAAELERCDAGYRFTLDGVTFPWRDRGACIPTLSQVLDQLPDVQLLIELKTAAAALPVRRVLERHGAGPRVMIASFLEAALIPFRSRGFLTSASRREILKFWAASRLGMTVRARDQAFSVPERYRNRIPVPAPGFVRAARRAGCPVHVWTVNDPNRARELWRRGVSGIITNYPALMVEARASL